MEDKLESITIESPTAPVMGRMGERAKGKATVLVSVIDFPHKFQLTFQSRDFAILDGLAEDIRKEVEKTGAALAATAADSLL